MNNHSSLSW